VVRFDATTCRTCPARPKCTSATQSGRQLSLRPRHIHEALEQARAEQTTDQWNNDYKIRAGVEGTMRQTTHVTGIRRARYLGLPKTTLEHNLTAAAINLIRYDAWLTGNPWTGPGPHTCKGSSPAPPEPRLTNRVCRSCKAAWAISIH